LKEFAAYIKTIHPPLSEEAVNALLGICTEVTFKKNTDVQVVGHSCRTIYFIKKGALRVYYFKGDTDITESLEFENAFVARIESLVTGQPSRKGIQAIEDSVLIAINADKLLELYDSYLEIERLIKKIFLNVFIATINRLESIQFHSAEVRYANLLKEHPDMFRRVPLKYIASYLGITQVSLSRIRAKH
jgi:CRP-like cAMP-binding protein